jgi:hypothetical protein
MGLHFDYRIVVGDKAFSWATKKDMPGVGSSIILWEQPVHDSAYALSKKVIIPTGQYGAGVTTLDWVRKGTVNNPGEDPEKFTLTTKRGERYLFKKLPTKYGEKAWLFKNLGSIQNEFLDKTASLIGGALGTHIAQNIATKAALGHKGISRYLANSFSEGVHGVVNTSLGSRAKKFLSGAILPDIAVAHRKAHDFGRAMNPVISMADKRQKVGLRMLSEGRIEDLKKHKLHLDPIIQKAHGIAKEHMEDLPALDSVLDKGKSIQKIFNDKAHPLASNILKNISRGNKPVGPQFRLAAPRSTLPVVGSLSSTLIDPSGGVINSAKTLMSSKTFSSTRLGKKINDSLEKHLVVKPIKSGLSGGAPVTKKDKLKHTAAEVLVNPVSANLKRTSAAITDALKT